MTDAARLLAYIEGHGEEDAFCRLANALEPFAKLMLPRCDYHGRDYVESDPSTGEEFCGECAGDDGLGELPSMSGDYLAELVLDQIEKDVA